MTHRLIIVVAAVTLMAATGFANAQGTGTSRGAASATAPAQEPKIETLSTEHADPTADRTVGQSVKPGKADQGDSDLAAAVRIVQQMSNETIGKGGRRHGR
jgi:hypothetical protein